MPDLGTFTSRFPELQDLMFEWEEFVPSEHKSGAEAGAFPHSMRAPAGRFEPVLACPNPRCRAGGFEVEFLVRSMIGEQLVERSGVLVCIGWEQEPRSRREGTACTRAISYRIRLSYRGPIRGTTQKDTNGNGEASYPQR